MPRRSSVSRVLENRTHGLKGDGGTGPDRAPRLQLPMTTARRPLGHGPQSEATAGPSHGTGPLHRSQADVDAAPLYRGGLPELEQLRERGVLGAPPPAA